VLRNPRTTDEGNVFIKSDKLNHTTKKVKMRKTSTKKMALMSRYILLGALLQCILISLVFANPTNLLSPAISGIEEISQARRISGKVISGEDQYGLPGVNVVEKGTTNGTITNVDGVYSLSVSEGATLVFSSVGYTTEEIAVGSRSVIDLVMSTDIKQLQEIVVVGYGEQKKESIVGSIAVITNETLDRRGGVSSISSALSGQIPGVTVLETTGEPGRNNPTILIRGMSTWNNAEPLVLVDGIERRMNDIDVSDVETISVLKDASATAVFGVKGANGVILITTKRGREGKANLNVAANMGIKTISKVFTVMDSYEGISWKNAAIEHEVSVQESAWQHYLPYEELLRFKKPQQYPYNYIFPNVDWKDEILKDFATSYRVNMNISGGTKFTKYYGSLAYLHEGDILNSRYNHEKGYNPGYSYDRLNFRGNLDFQLTNTTKLSVNQSGYIGSKKHTQGQNLAHIYRAIYNLPPDAFPVRHEDGLYGRTIFDNNIHNPLQMLNDIGISRNNRSQIANDIKLTQKLDALTKGLSASAHVSYDVYFTTTGPNISDGGNVGQSVFKYISPAILYAETRQDSLSAINYILSTGSNPVNEFDYVYRPWTMSSEAVANNSLARELFYQASLNYARTFSKHNVSGLFLFNRRENASGAEFKRYREDWVGRVTYNFYDRYFAEFNGAYNGSEMFGPGYRFGFFPSAAAGWMMTNEPFIDIRWLDKIKFRGSIGKVGNDAGIPRWGYIGSWRYGALTPPTPPLAQAQARFGRPNMMDISSPYTFYSEGTIGNPNLHWENSLKKNFGVELGFLQNAISLNLDVFRDDRRDIFLSASQRSVPAFFGAPAVPANLGRTKTTGYEVELNLRKSLNNTWSVWSTLSMTHAKDQIIYMEDPEVLSAYQKFAGYAIGQTRTTIREGFINNWDDAYAGASGETNTFRLPGDWALIDYNGDGIINTYDRVPFGFPTRPENTYSGSLGIRNKNFSAMLQFYGVTNIHRDVDMGWPTSNFARVPQAYSDYWTPNNLGATVKAPRIVSGSPNGDFTLYDGSFLRLKTAEIGYILPERWTGLLGLSSCRLYVNGNNLFFWSNLPQDAETGSFNIGDAYPMFRHFNFGINVGF
jgi:TonB-linked SusC/RagA family outer membrane protein